MAKTPRKGDNFVTTRDQELPKGGVLIRVPKGTPGQVVTRHWDGSLYVIVNLPRLKARASGATTGWQGT